MSDDFMELDTPADPRLRIGGNQPPLADVLKEETAALIARKDELLGAVGRVPEAITDETTAGRVADLIRLMLKCKQQAQKDHRARKEPFLEGGRLVDGAYKAITDPLDRAKSGVEAKLTVYQRAVAEEERRAREAEARRQTEEAARQRREAEAAAAKLETEDDLDAAITAEEIARQAAADAAIAQRATTVKAAELGRARGEFGSVASLTTFIDFKDLDRATIDLDALRSYLDITAIEKAIRLYIRSGARSLRGCAIFENSQSRVR